MRRVNYTVDILRSSSQLRSATLSPIGWWLLSAHGLACHPGRRAPRTIAMSSTRV